MLEEKKEEKKTDYLEKAKAIYEGAETYEGSLNQGKIKAAQTMATISIAEELRRLNEILMPKVTPIPTPRPEPSDEGELAKKMHKDR